MKPQTRAVAAMMSGAKIRYLLRDEFITALAAGSVNGTKAEPGPGARVVVDTNSKLSITGGQLAIATGGGGTDDPRISYASLARTAGRVLVAKTNVTTEGVIIALSDLNTASRQSAIRLYDTTIAIDKGAASYLAVGAYSTATEYQIAIVLKAAGEYVFIKGGAFTTWELLYADPNGASTPLYPIIGADDNASVYVVDYLRVPDKLWLPTPLAYDTFTRSNGALGNSETSGPDSQSTPARAWQSGGSTWAIASNEAVNTPTQGAELPTDGGLEVWTNPTNLTNWTESISGTSTINQEAGVVHGGSNAARMDIDAGNDIAYFYQSPGISVGDWVRASVWARSSAGTPSAAFSNSGGGSHTGAFDTTTTYTQYIRVFRVTAATSFGVKRISAASLSLYFDDISAKVLALNTLFSNVETSTADVVAQVELDTLADGCPAGLVLNLNNVSSPTNFVIAYLTSNEGTMGTNRARLDKCVAGTYTSVIDAAITYAAGANLVVVKDGTSYSLYYNNAQVGSTSTISDAGIISNTLHGMFSTYSGNQLDNFQVFPRGTNNEYQKLSDY